MGAMHHYKQKVAHHLIDGNKTTVDWMDRGTHEHGKRMPKGLLTAELLTPEFQQHQTHDGMTFNASSVWNSNHQKTWKT